MYYTILYNDKEYTKDLRVHSIGYWVSQLLQNVLYVKDKYVRVDIRTNNRLIYAGRYVEPVEMAVVLAALEIRAHDWKGKPMPGYDRRIDVKKASDGYSVSGIECVYYIDILQKHAARKLGIVC